jgi:hypothetical protein
MLARASFEGPMIFCRKLLQCDTLFNYQRLLIGCLLDSFAVMFVAFHEIKIDVSFDISLCGLHTTSVSSSSANSRAVLLFKSAQTRPNYKNKVPK